MKSAETKSMVLLHHHLKPSGFRPSEPSAKRWPPRPRPDNVDHLAYLLQPHRARAA